MEYWMALGWVPLLLLPRVFVVYESDEMVCHTLPFLLFLASRILPALHLQRFVEVM